MGFIGRQGSERAGCAMKVLHVAQPVDGGVANVVRTLTTDQRARGWSPVIASPSTGELPELLRAGGFDVRAWEATRSPGLGVVGEVRSLARIVSLVRPDVVHLHGSKAGLVGRAAIRGKLPTLFQPHLWSFQSQAGLTVRPARAWERLAVRWTDRIVCVSHDEAEVGRAMGIRCSSVVIPNGVDTQRIQPREKREARAEFGIPDEGPVVVCVARLAPLKGQDMLLEAWPGILERVPGARLVFVGDGPLREQLQRDYPVALDPSVIWTGWSDRASEYFSAADVVAVPSRAEGMALVPLEAMSSGRSVVAFDAGGIRESVGDAGVVLRVGDVEGLGNQIARRLINTGLAAEEGRRGRERAIRLFDHRTSAAAVADAVTDIANTEKTQQPS